MNFPHILLNLWVELTLIRYDLLKNVVIIVFSFLLFPLLMSADHVIISLSGLSLLCD